MAQQSVEHVEGAAPPGRGGAGARIRHWAPLVAALAATVAVLVTAPADEAHSGSAALDVLGGRQLRIMAPAAPGGGWDQTSREMQGALRDLVGRTEVYNVAGAGGTIGLSQFVRLGGDPTQLMTTGLIMVGAVEPTRRRTRWPTPRRSPLPASTYRLAISFSPSTARTWWRPTTSIACSTAPPTSRRC